MIVTPGEANADPAGYKLAQIEPGGAHPGRPLSRFPELPWLPYAAIFAAWDPTRLNSGPPTAPATAKG